MADGSAPVQAETAQEAAMDDVVYIQAFLSSVKPLRGCCFCRNERFHSGREAISQLALAYATRDDDRLEPTLAQCVDMLEFISCVEPLDEAIHHASGGPETCGLNLVLKCVQDRIIEAIGKDD